jgi:hypothetical protein
MTSEILVSIASMIILYGVVCLGVGALIGYVVLPSVVGFLRGESR